MTASWESLRLWPHQKDAIKAARRYLNARPNKAALIRMPTGSGKTGVIAVIARCFPDIRHVLAITPWTSLRDQLADDIESRFWEHIGTDPGAWPKNVRRIVPKSAVKTLREPAPTGSVLLSTIPALQDISKARASYEALRRSIDLVVVDEGHREPAHEWAQTVRNLGKPVILLTATPFRNDHKLFDVDPRHVYSLSHRDAEARRFIRAVAFEECKFDGSPAGFVGQLLEFYDGAFKKRRPDIRGPHRVIVRCETRASVKDVARELQKAGRKVIALHERFPGKGAAIGDGPASEDGGLERQDFPPADQRDFDFWVHQNKLLEGIDDPNFTLLAIYERFRSTRSLVQQIGRIIRNPGQKPRQTAWVFCDRRHRQREWWEAYRKHEPDQELKLKGAERQLFDTMVTSQPEVEYLDGRWCERFDFSRDDLHRQLQYPLRTNAAACRPRFSMTGFRAEVKAEWRQDELDIRSETPDAVTPWVFVYAMKRNCPILLDRSFAEFRIGYTICHRKGDHLFFYDSLGRLPGCFEKWAEPLRPHALEKLFRGREARISSLSLMNTDLGQHSIRRRTLNARSLADTAPGLADHVHFCSTAVGYTGDSAAALTRRYVGFSRGRISDSGAAASTYDEYSRWLEMLSGELADGSGKAPTLFGRFAKSVAAPSDARPANILLDLDETWGSFSDTRSGKRFSLDDLCYAVDEAGRFDLVANGRRYAATVRFDKASGTYYVASDELNQGFLKQATTDSPAREGLVAHINRAQAFRIVPVSPGRIYAHRHFYEPRLPVGGDAPSKMDILQILCPVPQLKTMADEKGRRCTGGSWAKGSLFHLIDTQGEGTAMARHFADGDLLVCDDMGTEVADFIAGDSRQKRIRLIHAKASSTGSLKSASDFQEVCGQATKNLDILLPFSDSRPNKLASWADAWRAPRVEGSVHCRIRKGPRIPQRSWEAFRSIICDPAAEREVWIVFGGGLSRKAFEDDARKDTPAPETIQLLYLLQSTWSAISTVGAKFRVYCAP
jgi:superfamily II DNA or RNA helicase